VKILFITGNYPPAASQNGNIVKDIVDEIYVQGHLGICLTKNMSPLNSSNDYGKYVHTVNANYWDLISAKISSNTNTKFEKCLYCLLVYVRKVWLAFHYKSYPNSEPVTTKRILKKAIELHKLLKFDCAIGVFGPFTSISTVIGLKKKYSGLVCGGYFLDIFEPKHRPQFMPKRLFNKLTVKGYINAFENLNFILLPKSSRNIFDNILYDQYRAKMHFVDFPAFIFRNELISAQKSNEQALKFVYTGTLDKSYRNPMHLLKIFEMLHKKGVSFEVEFYGKCNCKDEIDKFALTSTFKVKHLGLVSKEIAYIKLYEADFLINVSNNLKNMVPSKIFELFATRKPIINYTSLELDPSLVYFEKYPAQITINNWESDDYQVNKLFNFINDFDSLKCDIDTIENIYRENTPTYIVNLICRIFDECHRSI